MSFEISNVLHKYELLFAFTEKIKTTTITKPTWGKSHDTFITTAISLPDVGLIPIKLQQSPLMWNFILHQKNGIFQKHSASAWTASVEVLPMPCASENWVVYTLGILAGYEMRKLNMKQWAALPTQMTSAEIFNIFVRALSVRNL